MLSTGLLLCLQILVTVHSFKVSSRIDVKSEPTITSSLHYHPRSLDPPSSDHVVYDAVYAGQKKPLTVDCTQPGIICKFPVVVKGKEESSKPIKQVEIPIIKGVDDKAEGREDLEEKDEVYQKSIIEEGKVPIFKGTVDIESLVANEKDIEETWILEKNSLNKKYQIPVKLIPSKYQDDHHVAQVYPVHHDFHDHYSGGDPYHFPSHISGSGWTPWMRAYPSVHNYPSQQPCQPPVYHQQPPPCRPAVAPTRKPTINIDDKVEKEED